VENILIVVSHLLEQLFLHCRKGIKFADFLLEIFRLDKFAILGETQFQPFGYFLKLVGVFFNFKIVRGPIHIGSCSFPGIAIGLLIYYLLNRVCSSASFLGK
jgi:ABC-type tungstate transport system substrate-binding protein